MMQQLGDKIGAGHAADTRPVAVVHIGLNKTGTTTIQTWLQANKAVLASRGIFYDGFVVAPPPSGDATGETTGDVMGETTGGLGGHIGFPAHAMSRAGRMVPRGKVRRELAFAGLEDQQARTGAFAARIHDEIAQSGCSKVIISTEALAEWLDHPSLVEAFDTWMRQDFRHVVYVLYLRDQVDWAASAYAQSIKGGATHSLASFLERRGEYNFYRLVQTWIKGTGGKRLRIRLFESDTLEGGDLLTDFAAAAGIDPAGLDRPARHNESPSPTHLSIMKLSNRLFGWAMSRQKTHDWNEKIARLPIGRGRKLRLNADQRAHVTALNAGPNERLRARAFKARDTLFASATKHGANNPQ